MSVPAFYSKKKKKSLTKVKGAKRVRMKIFCHLSHLITFCKQKVRSNTQMRSSVDFNLKENKIDIKWRRKNISWDMETSCFNVKWKWTKALRQKSPTVFSFLVKCLLKHWKLNKIKCPPDSQALNVLLSFMISSWSSLSSWLSSFH